MNEASKKVLDGVGGFFFQKLLIFNQIPLVAEYGLLFLYRVSVIKPCKGWVVISGHNNLTNETYIFTPFPVGGNQSGYIHFNLIKIGSL